MTSRTISLVLAVVVLACGCSTVRHDQFDIRDSLLNRTPLGSKYEEVIALAKREGWRPITEAPGQLGGAWAAGFEPGGKWIKGHLGHYQHHHRWGTTDMDYRVDVFAYWCFDSSGKLTNLVVQKANTYGA